MNSDDSPIYFPVRSMSVEEFKAEYPLEGRSMKIRMHRGGLEAAMCTAEVIEPTLEAIQQYLMRNGYSEVHQKNISVEKYSERPDQRIGWDRTCLVLVNGYPAAMTDQLVSGIAACTK